GDIALGGSFRNAGAVRSPHIARYTLSPTSGDDAPAAPSLRLAVAPNPTRAGAVATVAGAAPGATMDVFDALGRRLHVQRLAGDGPPARRLRRAAHERRHGPDRASRRGALTLTRRKRRARTARSPAGRGRRGRSRGTRR